MFENIKLLMIVSLSSQSILHAKVFNLKQIFINCCSPKIILSLRRASVQWGSKKDFEFFKKKWFQVETCQVRPRFYLEMKFQSEFVIRNFYFVLREFIDQWHQFKSISMSIRIIKNISRSYVTVLNSQRKARFPESFKEFEVLTRFISSTGKSAITWRRKSRH